MSLVLQPQASFTVVRQIANHLDTATYYVQAVIRNAYTDAIIATLQLTDKGGQRFSKNWQVPADSSGQGFYISIVTSVYSDSGYTTKSENYGDEENTYLVQDRVSASGRGAFAGNSGIDARTLRRVIQEELDKRPYPDMPDIPEPKEPEMRWEEVLSGMKALESSIAKIPSEHPDLSELVAGVERAISAVEAKEVTPETDISPVLTKLEALMPALASFHDSLAEVIKNGQEKLSTDVLTDLATIMKNLTFTIAPTTAKMDVPKPQKQEAPRPPTDIESLAA